MMQLVYFLNGKFRLYNKNVELVQIIIFSTIPKQLLEHFGSNI